MLQEHFYNYANQIFTDALLHIPQKSDIKKNVAFEPVFTDEIISKIKFTEPRTVIYSYGFSMLIYRIVRLALACNPMFYSDNYKHSHISKDDAIIILTEIIRNIKENLQGGIDYPVSQQVIQMSEVLTKDADIFFVLHELCHCLIIDDAFSTLIPMLTWGTYGKIPNLNDERIEHEILADRLASVFMYQKLLIERDDDYYERLKIHWKQNLEGQDIEKLKKQDLGLKLIGIECALFTQLILEKFDKQDHNYLNFSDRVNWNRKFLVDVYGFSEDVFFIPEAIIGYMIELLKEVKLN